MVASCEVRGGLTIFPGDGTLQTDGRSEMQVLKSSMERRNKMVKNYQMFFRMSIMGVAGRQKMRPRRFFQFSGMEKVTILDSALGTIGAAAMIEAVTCLTFLLCRPRPENGSGFYPCPAVGAVFFERGCDNP
jgi:hypothetical protein